MSLNHAIAPTDVPTLAEADRDRLEAADQVITFRRPSLAEVPEVVIELRDLHRNLLARSTVNTRDEPTVVVDQLLAAAQLDRCSDFLVDPIGRKKVRRTIASVCPGVRATTSAYETARTSAPGFAI